MIDKILKDMKGLSLIHIFSYLSYIEFGKLLENGDGFFDLKEQYEHFCEKHSMEEIKTAGQFTRCV